MALGWEIISSGGTAAALRDGGVDVTEVAEVTGAREMLDGRVKTIHPIVHGGILADRSKPEHLADLAAAGAQPIDLVVCNLYPFGKAPSIEMIDIGGPAMVRAAAKNHAHVGVAVDPADYGAVIEELEAEHALSESLRRRLARKAFAHCASYDAAIVTWLDSGAPEPIEEDVPAGDSDSDNLPESLVLRLRRAEVLRYGENPGQLGARYRLGDAASWWDTAAQLGGKQLSYLNVYDTDAAWRLAHALGSDPAAVVVKHANPCGAAAHTDIAEAYRRAHACDPVSAFGGVVALNRTVTAELAESLAEVFTEVVVAPGYNAEALKRLQARRNLRILQARAPEAAELQLRSLGNSFLVQTAPAPAAALAAPAAPAAALAAPAAAPAAPGLAGTDLDGVPCGGGGGVGEDVRGGSDRGGGGVGEDVPDGSDGGGGGVGEDVPGGSDRGGEGVGEDVRGGSDRGGGGVGEDAPDGSDGGGVDGRDAIYGWEVVTDRHPAEDEWRDLVFAWRVVAAVSSNAIVVAKDRCAVGIGAGQQNRRDAGRIAATKAGDRGHGGAYASDAFLPFADGLDGAIEAGCTAVVQPGGSVRDAEVIEAANHHGMAMVFTGRRAFRH